MKKIDETKEKEIIEDITPTELLRVLKLYGMKIKEYTALRGKSSSWWYTVLCMRKFVTYLDMKTLADSIGKQTFNALLEKVRQKYPTTTQKIIVL
jgi:hypothetical protein